MNIADGVGPDVTDSGMGTADTDVAVPGTAVRDTVELDGLDLDPTATLLHAALGLGFEADALTDHSIP